MIILGIDEVGRGPLAGPLVVAACALPEYFDENKERTTELWQTELKDSKKLSAKKREELDPKIRENAITFGIGWVSSKELDKIGMPKALKVATYRAVTEAKKIADFDQIIIDGTQNFLKGTEYESITTTLIKADDKIKAVSAASIIAKVVRDNYMKDLALKYPEYGFEKHVGYGTKQHQAALEKFGPCPEHRRSVKPVAKKISQTTALGTRAEQVVADYLASQGHKILARNYRTKFYEIDIISTTHEHIYFTEVKYRKSSEHGSPLEFIDKKKQRQIKFAASSFMKYLSKKMGRGLDDLPSPILAAAAVEGKDFTLANWGPIVV